MAKSVKTALQRDSRATHGVARVAIGTAEERFFHGSERSAESKCPAGRGTPGHAGDGTSIIEIP